MKRWKGNNKKLKDEEGGGNENEEKWRNGEKKFKKIN